MPEWIQVNDPVPSEILFIIGAWRCQLAQTGLVSRNNPPEDDDGTTHKCIGGD